MAALRRRWFTTNRIESSIVLVGFLFAVVGLLLRDSAGIADILVAFGTALFVAGTAYAAAAGRERFRLSIAFVSLVAVQLLAVGGPVQWGGGIAIGSIVVAIAYSRLRG